ncbi:MAG: SDR family oxidoreductase [Bacteroidales bacterium]|nr:SDR family oxidoreductase [Bacteroidales bacterium]HOI31473.1 SDR family oxidoreductase [Bacteroidales bacterium]
MDELKDKQVLVTGGAGFIGSNLIETLLQIGAKVSCLDNFATGHHKNIEPFLQHPAFQLIEGDIRDIQTCQEACKGQEIIFHQAALGSVPRSIKDPATTNAVNISGSLNMMIAARDSGAKRFVYAASSSTYGDSESLPKVEEKIGRPLSPYAITKYANELYADVFTRTYGLESIGLRYFNVFGRRQDPEGAYAAVIPKWVKQFMRHEAIIINGQGEYSRDFTYIENVIQANLKAATTTNPQAVNQVYNVAYGDRTTLNDLAVWLREALAGYDAEIAAVKITHGPYRQGDIPHSLASIEKGRKLLGYDPQFNLKDGLKEACKWYWENLS